MRSNHTPYQRQLHEVKSYVEELREFVKLQLQGAALQLISGLFAEEVERLCGDSYSRKSSGYYRGGSDPGSVKLSGQRLKVKKPRIRKDGKEVHLESYGALQDFDLLCEDVMKHMLCGVSTRNYDPLLETLEGGLGLKKSSVSRAFINGSQKALDDLNGKDLSKKEWFCLLIDGIEFSGSHVLVAMGITVTGKKHILGLREGSSENHEVCKDLIESIIERGFPKEASQLLFVLDGSKALRKAVHLIYGEETHVQRCIRHKERNLLAYLPDTYHPELRRRWKMIHSLSSFSQATEELQKLYKWLQSINHQAANSLEEANDETLTIIKLGAPELLRKSLSSTNLIESPFDRVRSLTRRVKNWKRNPSMVSRWVASALSISEKKFRKIRGYQQIQLVLLNMRHLTLQKERNVA